MDALEGADEDKIADLTRALAALRSGENAAQKVALAEEKNAIQKEPVVALATDRRLGSDEKTERLGRLMFGDLWESDK